MVRPFPIELDYMTDTHVLMAHCVTGSCWDVTYEGQSVMMTVVDHAGDGYTLSKKALDTLTCVDS